MTETPSVHQFGGVVNRFVDQKNAQQRQFTLPLSSIILPKHQPRKYFDAKKLEELQHSIEQYGILEPLIVRPMGEDQFELVAGERRYRAASALRLPNVPVTVRELNDKEALHVAIIENLQRENLNPVEETRGMLNLLSVELSMEVAEVKALLHQMRNQTADASQNVLTNIATVEKLFAAIGKMTWSSFITTRLVLLNLPEEVIDAVERGEIAYTKAQLIAQVKDAAKRQELLNEAVSQNLSLSAIRKEVNDWKKSDAGPSREKKVETPLQRTKALYEKMKKRNVGLVEEEKILFDELLTKLENLLADDEPLH